MATTSRMPAVVDALVAAAQSLNPGVSVVDGPPLSWSPLQYPTDQPSLRQAVFIGAAPGEETGGDAPQSFNAAGNISRDERGVIHCTAWSGAGDQNIKSRRDEAFAIVGAIETLIASNGTLSGAVLYAGPVAVTRYTPRQLPSGPDCIVEFDVPFRSYLS